MRQRLGDYLIICALGVVSLAATLSEALHAIFLGGRKTRKRKISFVLPVVGIGEQLFLHT